MATASTRREARRALSIVLGSGIAVCTILSQARDGSTQSEPYNYVHPSSNSFPVAKSVKPRIAASKWCKHKLSDINVRHVGHCPLANPSGGSSTIDTKTLEISLPGSEPRIYLCANDGRTDQPDDGSVSPKALIQLAKILKNDTPNQAIVRHVAVKIGNRDVHRLIGLSILDPAKFSRTYPMPDAEQCCEPNTPDRLLLVPLRLVSATAHECAPSIRGVKIVIPRFDAEVPTTFSLCTDQAHSDYKKIEILTDITYIQRQATRFDRQNLLLTYKKSFEKTAETIREVNRVTGVDFMLQVDPHVRVQAKLMGDMRRVMSRPPIAAGGPCRMGPRGLLTRITCGTMGPSDLLAWQLDHHIPKTGSSDRGQEITTTEKIKVDASLHPDAPKLDAPKMGAKVGSPKPIIISENQPPKPIPDL